MLRPSWRGVIFAGVATFLGLACFRQFSKHVFVSGIDARDSGSRSIKPSRANLLPGLRGANPSLLFDPVLVYSTLLGSSVSQGIPTGANVTFVDGPGNVYVGGFGTVQVTPGVVQPNRCEGCPGFLSKIDSSGQSLAFSTYIQGIPATAIAIDSSGNIYVAGQVPPAHISDPVSTPILPIPSGFTPFQAAPRGRNVGILKLNSTATAILGATYLGGSGVEQLAGLAVDSDGSLYIAGNTTSNDFPVSQNPLQSSLGSSGHNMFVTKLNGSLGSAVYSTYLGQNSAASVPFGSINSPNGGGIALAVDTSKNAYVVGNAGSGFPTTTGAVQGTCPAVCAFVAKLDAAGSSLLYATYLAGPSGGSTAYTVALDSSQNIYVGGTTTSGFPEVRSLQSCNQGGGFVSQIDVSGALTFSTCLGRVSVQDVVSDAAKNVHLVGYSDTTLPLENPIQSNPDVVGTAGPFVASISPNSNPPSLLFSSFIGSGQGSEEVSVEAVVADSGGNIYVIGSTFSAGPVSFPVFNALQPVSLCNGCDSSSAFIMKISPTDAAAAALSPGGLTFPAQQVSMPSSPQTITVLDMGSATLTVSNVTSTGDFSVQNNCGTVSPAGGTCTIQVTFTPTATGTRNGILTITDSSAGSPRTVALTGQGAIASLTATPASLSFGSQAVGTTSASQAITLSNPSSLAIALSRIQISGEFAETNTCGTTIAPQASCTVNVIFTPTATGTQTGAVTIMDNATSNPQIVQLSGTGTNATLGLSVPPGSSSETTVQAGASTTYKLSVGGMGMGGTASLSCTGAPAGATCTVPASVSMNAISVSTFNVNVSTTARTMAVLHQGGFQTATWPWTVAILGWVSLLGSETRRCSARSWLRLLFLIALLAFLCSCGGSGSNAGNNPNGTPAGTYTLAVTAQSGSTIQSLNLTLTVQ